MASSDWSHWSWLNMIPGVSDDSITHALGVHGGHGNDVVLLSSWGICLGLIGAAALGRVGLNKARARGGTLQYVPDTRLSIRNFWELYVGGIFDLSEGVLGKKDTRRFFALFGALFIYIWFNNLLAVVPGGQTPSASISNNAAMAIIVFLVFNFAGLKANGLGYIKHMAGPVWWLAWLILPIELVGLIVRPVSLSLRLMGNMVGDHTVFGIMSDLIPVLVPSVFLGLGIFVSTLQAFVFTLLSIIYVSLSVAHDDDH